MEIAKDTKIKEILIEYPWLLDEGIKMEPKLKIAKTPIGKAFINKATVADICNRIGMDPDMAIKKLNEFIASYGK